MKANYVQEREHNVPRKNMYEHYKGYCNSSGLPPVNSATFGKLLRNVFPDLKTRRLGVRGQSKYHYCGIRVRNEADQSTPAAPIVATTEDEEQPRFINKETTPTPTPGELPSFSVPIIPPFRFNNELEPSVVASFTTLYERHCRDILYFVSTNQVVKVRGALKSFYGEMPLDYVQLVHSIPEIIEAMWRWDCTLYDVKLIYQ